MRLLLFGVKDVQERPWQIQSFFVQKKQCGTMNNQRIVAQMANVDLIVEIRANLLICDLFRRLVVVGDKIKNGIQVVLLRSLRQAVILHVGHEAFTQRSAAAFQNFGSCAFLRRFRKVISLPLVRFRRSIFWISGILCSFLRNVSTLFGFLTIVRYGMGVLVTHVCCLSRSMFHSGWVDKVKVLVPVAAGIAYYYIINPGIIKTRTRRFSLISIAVGRLQSALTLRRVCGFRTGSHSTFETLKVFAA